MLQTDLTQRLTQHFVLKEFAVSGKHPRLADRLSLTPQVVADLGFGCRMILEPFRIRRPDTKIIIISGYRSSQLNAAVGGSPGSVHMVGCGSDFVIDGPDHLSDVFLDIAVHSHLLIRELRYYIDVGYIHLAWNSSTINNYKSEIKIVTGDGRFK